MFLIFSLQSCENAIICWKPGRLEDPELRPGDNSVTIVHRFDYKECEIWFIRFAVDYSQRVRLINFCYNHKLSQNQKLANQIVKIID